MKRILALLLTILLLLQAACGAKPEAPLEEINDPASEITEQPEEESAPEAEQQPETQPEETPEEETPPAEELPKASILDNRLMLSENGTLWQIPNERVEANLQQNLFRLGDHLLLAGSIAGPDGTPALDLALLSMETGEVLQETTLSGFDLPNFQPCGDKFAINDWADGQILLLDSSLATVAEYDVEAESCGVYLNPDATTAYCFRQDGIYFTELSTGLTGSVMDNAAHLFVSTSCGDTVSFFYTDPATQLDCRMVFDLATGTAEAIPFDGIFSGATVSDGLWLATLADDSGYYLGKAGHPNLFQPTAQYGSVSLLTNPTRILVSAYDNEGYATISLYEADGSFLSEITLPVQGGAIIGDPLWSQEEGGYFFTMTNALGKDMLFFWDLSTPVAGESLSLSAVSTEQPAGTAVSAALYDRAAAISETYGVTVRIAEQIQTEYVDFYVTPILEESYLSAGLDTLETVLSAYPDGFLAQLRYGSYGPLEIHLGGQLQKFSPAEDVTQGFNYFVGLTSELSGAVTIAIDVTMPGSMEQTLHHELMHAIDNKLTFDANLREDALFSEEDWAALNPAGFAYAESYHNLPASIYGEGFENYFTETYSRTFAREDRSTIMEYAMVGADWMFSAAPGRQAKLDYLCRCIRDAFDTTGWPETTVWEATLNRSK